MTTKSTENMVTPIMAPMVTTIMALMETMALMVIMAPTSEYEPYNFSKNLNDWADPLCPTNVL